MSVRGATTVEAWVRAYIRSTDLESKLTPPPRPTAWEEPTPAAERIDAPGRPAELTQVARAKKAITGNALLHPRRRAEIMHRFLCHELQAAELMGWALLAFPDTPRAFRVGLLGILDDEVRHMRLYREYIEALGYGVSAFPLRDWFWERIPSAATPAAFCATMGIGFEGGNLDHASRFAIQFEQAGDAEAARITRVVHDEEIPHVRFALHWFRRFAGEPDFETWRAHLPAPLSPVLMKGNPLDAAARGSAGFSAEFLARLSAWSMSGT
jgi:uncharacterized ferritin-like protein (DUF455 family)